jgi:hypothetical protein
MEKFVCISCISLNKAGLPALFTNVPCSALLSRRFGLICAGNTVLARAPKFFVKKTGRQPTLRSDERPEMFSQSVQPVECIIGDSKRQRKEQTLLSITRTRILVNSIIP